MTEEAPGAQHDVQRQLQDVVAGVVERHSGDDLSVVRTAIEDGLAGVGIDPQPEKWLNDTAAEISDGRHVVVDRSLGAGGGGLGPDDPHEQ